MSAQYYQSTEFDTFVESDADGHPHVCEQNPSYNVVKHVCEQNPSYNVVNHACQQNPSYNVVKPKSKEGIYQEIQYQFDATGGSIPGSASVTMAAPNVVRKINSG